MTLVSIIIPTYNRASTIVRTLESVLSQRFSDWEVIIVDDQSTDNTLDVVKSFFSYSRIIYKQVSKMGVSAARNIGATMATGDYLLFLDSDDEFLPGYLQEVSNALSYHPDVVFVGVQFVLNGMTTRMIDPRRPSGKPDDAGLFLAGSFLLKRDIYNLVGGYDPVMRQGENTELALRLEGHLTRKEFISKPLLQINQTETFRQSHSLDNLIISYRHTLSKNKVYYEAHPYEHWLYLNVLGTALYKDGQKMEALRCFLKAIKIKPLWWKSYLRIIKAVFY